MKDQSIQAYLASQRTDKNRPTVLAFPVLYPREVLTALDLCAWERWSEHPSSDGADAGKLQGYLCPTVRGAQGVLARKDHGAQAAIIPHTCDSMQGLAAIAKSTPGWEIPVVTFRHPRGTDRPASRLFLREELKAFIASLEDVFDRKLDLQKLTAAIELHRKLEALLSAVLRGRPWLDISDEDLYATLRQLEYKHPEDFCETLQPLASKVDRTKRRDGIGLVISGMVPEPEGFFETLDDAGGYVAADDYAALGRRLPAYDGPIEDDPIGSVVERLLLMPPCPTRSSKVTRRIAHLLKLATDSGARGVILHTVKFCEPELFDVATLRRGLEKEGLKVLHVETEFEPQVTGQIATRLEAFLEMLDDGRSE